MKRLLLAVMVLVSLVGLVGLSRAAKDAATQSVTPVIRNIQLSLDTISNDQINVVVSVLQASANATNEAVSTLQATGNDGIPARAKMYYLTENTFDGGDAIMACDFGFHMASISEIQDPSNLQYANRSTAAYDSLVDGQRLGAPSNRMGWVRSGVYSPLGVYDCGDWRGKYDTQLGNTLALYDFWYASEHEQPVSHLNTWWQAARQICSQPKPVWCAENPQNEERD